ncbi:HAMP domain-containing sensor histidine kinase [Microbacterium sp. NPDC077184]|uniref:sensor histidine kinase n=1 Tax=Microbacterium sp. NPDC077184 TaxID=3154764 RepID=UPI0034169EFC
MTGRTDAAIEADRRRVQRAALRAGLWVGLASAAVVAILTTVTVAGLFATSREEPRLPGGEFEEHSERGGRVIDLDDAIPLSILLGVIGVVVLAVIGWYVARRAAQPLAEALEVQRTFVADASHELRTPLTTLSSRVQLAQHRAERGGDVAAVLADLRKDTEAMDAVLSDLLLSAESAGARVGVGAVRTDVGPAIQDALSLLAPRAEERGVTLAAEVADGLAVAADRVAVIRALSALIDNALKYAPAGSAVDVRATGTGAAVEIRVADSGPGITGIDPDRIFDRFARADAGAVQSGGHGLGLALVRDIAGRFGGSIALESTSPAGSTFLLTLPAAR